MLYKIGDLWGLYKSDRDSLTTDQIKQVTLAGRELTGSDNERYKALIEFVDPPLTILEQAQLD